MENTYVEPADPLNVIEQINSMSEQNDFQEICVICQDILDNGETQFFTLPECSHCFHTNCIVTWFNQYCLYYDRHHDRHHDRHKPVFCYL